MRRRSHRVLEIELTREIEENPFYSPFLRRETLSLIEVVEALRRATADPRIAGLLVRFDGPEIGWAKAESLHQAIRRFRASGRPALAVVSQAGNSTYFVAAAASTVALDPVTNLNLHALAMESFFFKDVLGELGIEPELDAVGEFKSSGEMFSRRESSDAHRKQTDDLLSDLHDLLVSRIAEARGLSTEAVTDCLSRGPWLPEEALDRKLVDRLAADQEAEDLLKEVLGGPVHLVPFRRYLRKGSLRRRLWHWRRPRVAVVPVLGVIAGGEARPRPGPRAAGARGLVDLLGALRRSRGVKAIVLRVDSPGGSALASDRIRRAVQETVKAKPVIVSMGDVAASGGYYIATAASAVIAAASTFTGSIGVIGGKFVVKRLLERLGIYREVRSKGPNAEFYSPFRSFSPEERARHRELLQHFYRTHFLPAVAAGRGLDLDRADELGRGRVWTGRQAHARGLVDSLGGTEEAISQACEKAGVPRGRARIVVYAPRRKLTEFLFPGIASGTALALLDAFELLRELAREELLLLAPRLLRLD
jgi:protease-4